MRGTIEKNSKTILKILAELPRNEGRGELTGNQIQKHTNNLNPGEIDDAVEILVSRGYAKWWRTHDSLPYHFSGVFITPLGRYEYERQTPNENVLENHEETRPPVPIGSPYGFSEEHWADLAKMKAKENTLHVVFGHQFKSDYYNTENLKNNIETMFEQALHTFNQQSNGENVHLVFTNLSAGYGEHLFNEIAKNIIGSDIAVFETSDMNPNVMIEMGVALTWGPLVLPIKLEDRPEPPSDISGQTWANYRNDGEKFVDSDHAEKLEKLIEKVLGKKIN